MLLPSHLHHSFVSTNVIPQSVITSFLRQLQCHSSISFNVIPPSVTTSFHRQLRLHSSVSYDVIPPSVTTSFLRQLRRHFSVSYVSYACFPTFQLERDRPTDRTTDGRTDKASYRVAYPQLKSMIIRQKANYGKNKKDSDFKNAAVNPFF